jgi:hypothetical protein
VVMITSNAKKDLSDPFLGRCNFHHIAFPSPEFMGQIVRAHFPEIEDRLATLCIETFYRLRSLPDIEKKPATRELLNWTRALRLDPGFNATTLRKGKDIPYLGILFKKSADFQQAQTWELHTRS